jgi:hypothetical protein
VAATRRPKSLLDRIEAIRVVSWEWNEAAVAVGEIAGERRIGVVAQEIETLFPELVSEAAHGYKQVDYSALAAIAILGVQELRRELRASVKKPKKKPGKKRAR